MSLDALTRTHTSSELPRTRKRSLTWLLPTGLFLGFAVVLAALFGDRFVPATEVSTARVTTIRTEASQEVAVSADGAPLFQATGWVEPDPYVTYVPTLINGTVDEVHVLEGQDIKKDDVLVTLIQDDAKLALASARQAVESHEKRIVAHCTGFDLIMSEETAALRRIDALATNLEDVRDTAERLNRAKKGAFSAQQLVQANLAVTRQEAMLAEAEAELPKLKARRSQLEAERDSMESTLNELETTLAKAQLALDRTTITAPMDGKVLHLHAIPGAKRMLDMDDPKSAVIVELYDPNQLQARIDVPLGEASQLSVGQSVEMVSDLLPDTTFLGEVTRINGEADLQRNTLQAKVEIQNPDPKLRPGMLVRAKFKSLAKADGVKSSATNLNNYIPEEAIISEDKVWTITTDNEAKQVTVQLGSDKRDDHRQVLGGLKSGERVILPPFPANLKDGLKVTSSNAL